MTLKNYLLLALIFIAACKTDSLKVKQKYYTEVEALSELVDQKEYLSKVYDNYIELRQSETDKWNTFGRHSPEYKNKVINNHKEDVKDLQRVIAFLETFGHPNIMKHGQKASYIPCVQLIHSQNDYLLRENFKYFYDGYKFNDISEDLFYKYLTTLNFASGKRHDIDEAMSKSENIEYLIEKLYLNQ